MAKKCNSYCTARRKEYLVSELRLAVWYPRTAADQREKYFLVDVRHLVPVSKGQWRLYLTYKLIHIWAGRTQDFFLFSEREKN